MKHVPIKALLQRRGMVARLLIVLLIAAVTAVICPMTTSQAQAAHPPVAENTATLETLKKTETGAPLGLNMNKETIKTVRFTSFANVPAPTDSHCWNAAETGTGLILGCATRDGNKWDVEYTANDERLRFPVDSGKLFAGWTSLTSITGLERVDTSNVTNMAEMFKDCRSLNTLDVSKFNTSKVTNMQDMFLNCHLLQSLDVTNFDTANVTDMASMFQGCRSLTLLDVANFKTSKVTNMANMFRDCHVLDILDVSKFDTVNVTRIDGMFFACRSLPTLDLSRFDTSKVQTANDALRNLDKLQRLVLGPKFKHRLAQLGLGAPYSPSKAGYTATNQWRNIDTSKVYASPSEIPVSVAGTYEPNYRLSSTTTTYTYKVRFDRNGGTGAMADQSFTSGAGRMLPANTFTRDGYTFSGWNTRANGSGTAYRDRQSVTDLAKSSNETVTLYARWTPNTYSIRYDLDGGKLPTNAPTSRKYGQATNLPTPTKSGHIFVGWYDASGKKVSAVPSNSKDVKLKARWTRASAAQLKRLGGADRYDTMARIVTEAYPKTAQTVLVASGENYPDALAASGLSGVLDAPVVLTASGSLSPQAASQLKRLHPKRIVIVGGTNAVSQRVQLRLKDYAPAVERLGGSDRYHTSYLLYQRGGRSWGSTAVVATGSNYADALSVSSYAYAGKAPVFLCDPGSGLTPQQRAALRKFGRVLVVGGEQAVSSRHLAGLPRATRLGGSDRYHTSTLLAQWTQSNGLNMNGAVYATGGNFPDALVAGPLAGRNKAPVLLVSGPRDSAIQHSTRSKHKVSKAYVVGGLNAVNAPTANAIADALGMRRP